MRRSTRSASEIGEYIRISEGRQRKISTWFCALSGIKKKIYIRDTSSAKRLPSSGASLGDGRHNSAKQQIETNQTHSKYSRIIGHLGLLYGLLLRFFLNSQILHIATAENDIFVDVVGWRYFIFWISPFCTE